MELTKKYVKDLLKPQNNACITFYNDGHKVKIWHSVNGYHLIQWGMNENDVKLKDIVNLLKDIPSINIEPLESYQSMRLPIEL